MPSNSDIFNLVDSLLDHDTPIADRRFPKGRGPYQGRQTGLGQSYWLSAVFNLNEIHASRKEYEKVLSDPQIYHNWNLEFGNKTTPEGNVTKPGGAIGSGKRTLGMYRREYRRGDLYSKQPKPILYSFKYSREKHPLKDGKSERNFLTFEQCRELCLLAKIADPRFFTREELVQIKHHAKKQGMVHLWSIPSAKQYEELDNAIVGGIYRSLITKDIWVDQQVPPDFSPPT